MDPFGLTPRLPGRHSAAFFAELPAPSPAPADPWSRPWTGPTKEEAAALFRREAETTMELGVIHERRRAAALATLGVDYPYTYEGAPFPRSAFAAAGGDGMTAEELFPVVLAGHVALCVECKTITRAPIPVRYIQSNSGPGTTLYACPEHAVKLGAGPTPNDEILTP